MKKTKSHSAAKAGPPPEERDEVLADRMLGLALELRDMDKYAVLSESLQKAVSDLRKAIKKCLQQQREQALDEAIERSFEEDHQAYKVLRDMQQEMAGTVLLRRDDGTELEVNAFVIPLFVHSTGGLRSEQCFQDEDAFEQLRESLKSGGLESAKASVVLVSHAYHLEEIEQIGYCELNAMVLEAADAMTRKKSPAANAIMRSMRGWPAPSFGEQDHAVELRFLLGFALKTLDDAFYHVPAKEAAADRYFEARAERFRKWSQQVKPLLQRCLVTDGRTLQIDFLYQDLFHNGKEAAVAEMEMLRLLSDVQRMLEEHGGAAAEMVAVIGPVETDDDALRVSLHAKEGDLVIGAVDRMLARSETMDDVIGDIADGLDSIGLREIRVARMFDAVGEPIGVHRYRR